MVTDKLILTDVDGVVLDWETHFHAWMKNQGHVRARQDNTYWQEMQYPALSKDEARKQVYYFNTSSWIIGMPAFRDARTGIARLAEEGYQFKAITAMGNDDYAHECRIMNLNNLFGKDVFVDVVVTDVYDPDSKRAELTKHKDSGLYWIEDRPSNAELGASLGLNTLLMEHAFNVDYEPKHAMGSVNSWKQIGDVILGVS